MNTFEQITAQTKSITALIEKGKDDFDIAIFVELQQLTDRIKEKRCISTQAARKIVADLAGMD